VDAEKRYEDPDGECSSDDIVSCWVGSFADEAALERYFGEDEAIWGFDVYDSITNREAQEGSPFWNDLDIPWVNLGLWRGCEYLVTRQTDQPVQISELVRGFPHASTFRDALAEACARQGILLASTAICMYDFAYDRDGVFAGGQLKFIGSFPYTLSGGEPGATANGGRDSGSP
jgi:hypothetical protein